MPIHKVRNPFFCHKDQFALKGFPGQVLVVGIDRNALQGEVYKMRIGTNPTIYEAPVAEIMLKGHRWINKKGKLVVITPVNLFKKKESKNESKEHPSVLLQEKKREIQCSNAGCGRDLFSL